MKAVASSLDFIKNVTPTVHPDRVAPQTNAARCLQMTHFLQLHCNRLYWAKPQSFGFQSLPLLMI
jgi:hypothetical protein